MNNYFVIKIFLFFLLIDFSFAHDEESISPMLLLISFDGFRWDYPDLYYLPNFNSILKRGVRVKHIDNSFATVTFPSHFTIVTGLYEETHGIVANQIYDPILKEVATIVTMNDTKWWYVLSRCSIGEIKNFFLGHKIRILNRFGLVIN
jgi:predicted AlkP superfamily pyrophosphatase or phosphodiesterase